MANSGSAATRWFRTAAGGVALRPPSPVLVVRILWALAGFVTLLFALEATKAAALGLDGALARLDISGTANSLGFGWLFAYVALSGSPVAATSISFLASGTFGETEAFAAIAGSRMGASLIVLAVGLVSYLRGRRQADGLAVGVLAFLVTISTQLPALFIGLFALRLGILDGASFATPSGLLDFIATLTGGVIGRLDDALPAVGMLAAGLGLLLVAFALFDRALPPMTTPEKAAAANANTMGRPWRMFFLGCAVTAVTLSVAVSVTLLVPLALRGYIRREQVIPYVMGANITTFFDTLVVAVLLGGDAAFTVVLVQIVAMTLVGGFILAFAYRPYAAALLRADRFVTHDIRRFCAFVAVIGIVPLALLFV